MSMDLFGSSMLDNYEERVVDHFETTTVVVDTCRVTDGFKPYETAVMHNDYNHGRWMIVEAYATIDQAKDGHNRWVKTMTQEKLPGELKNVVNCEIALLDKIAGNSQTYKNVNAIRKVKKGNTPWKN